MKLVQKITALAVSSLMMFSIAGMNVFAASTTQDGLEVSLTTDKETYSKDEKITATLSVKNTNAKEVADVAVEDVEIEIVVPDGYKADGESSTTKKLETLSPNETIDLNVVLIADVSQNSEVSQDSEVSQNSEVSQDSEVSQNSEVSQDSEVSQNSEVSQDSQVSTIKPNDNTVNTGENSSIVLFFAIVLVVSVLITIVCLKNKQGRKLFSVLLTVSLLSSSAISFSVKTNALEDNTVHKSIELMETINVDGSSLTISAKIIYSLDKNPDTDKDGVSDVMEALFGTDPTKDDTDGDRLSDNFEIFYSGTDPILTDTDDNGINDFDEDEDEDGLTNGIEQSLGTRPDLIDTDGDRLSDGDEVNKYGTNPLLVDSDGDGLTDYEEVSLGLNPSSILSDGKTPDSERKFNQKTSDNVKDDQLIESDSWLIPYVSGSVSGLIDYNISLEKDNMSSFAQNSSVLSDVIVLETAYDDELTLNFSISDSFESYSEYAKSLCMVEFKNEELSVLNTQFDPESNVLSASIKGNGYYFVMDVGDFLNGLGIDVISSVETYKSEVKPRGTADYLEPSTEPIQKLAKKTLDDPQQQDNNQKMNEKISFAGSRSSEDHMASNLKAAPKSTDITGTYGKADIVFVIDTTGSMRDSIYNVQSNINTFAEKLTSEYKVDVNYGLIEYRDIEEDGVDSTKQHKSLASNWFTNVNTYKSEINSLSVDGGGDTPETPLDALDLARRSSWRSGSTKFVVLVTDADSKNTNTSGIVDMQDMAEKFKSDGIVVSAIASNETDYIQLISETDGLYGYINGKFSDILLALANKIGVETNDGGDWILLSDYTAVHLKGSVDDIATTDSDGDYLKDAEEIYNEHTVSLNRLIEVFLTANGVPTDYYKGKKNITVWSYYSNPVLPDTDFDGIKDSIDEDKRNNVLKGYFHWKEDDKAKTSKQKIELRMDYRNFLLDNAKYYKDLSVMSILGASDIYKDCWIEWTDGVTGGSDAYDSFLNTIGCESIENYKITSKDGLDVDDKTELAVGKHTIETADSKQTVVIVEIRGTNGTNEEWSSNFDVGADTDDYYNKTGEHPDWTHKDNHKGFDVAANRALKSLEKYLNKHSISSGTILFTGHSRGAAIADLMGAAYEDNPNFKSFTYAFATPFNTTNKNAPNYKTIFNVVNGDDLVPLLPLEKWGFKKYGHIKEIKVSEHYENKWGRRQEGTWEWLVGKDYNSISQSNLNNAKNSFYDIAHNREDIYVYDNSSDGTVWEDNMGHTTLSGAQKELVELTEKLKNEKLYKYCQLNIVRNGLGIYHVEVNYCPAYFMQVLVNMTVHPPGNDSIFQRDVKGKYVTAKRAFVGASGKVLWIGGMQDTHEPLTYYLIAHNNFVESV